MTREYKGFKLEQDNSGSGMFAVIPTYSIIDKDDNTLAKRMLLSDAKIFIDAKIKGGKDASIKT